MTHFEAKRLGLLGLPEDQIPKAKTVLKKIHLLLPIFVIIILLYNGGMSIERVALYGILSTIIVSMFLKETRIGFRGIIDALVSGAKTALGVAAATATAGIIVGVVTKTGLGLKMGNSLVGLAEAMSTNIQMQLMLTLVFTMITSLILGMGSPTTANYIITSTIALPALFALNAALPIEIPVLAMHMFVFYFGIVADITPPVALAAFAATGISKGDPIKTGFNAAKLAIAAFIIPYMFVLQPQLLMIDTTILEVSFILATAIIGMIGIGAGMIGFWYVKLKGYERFLAVISGLMLIYPGLATDGIGLAIFIALLLVQMKRGKEDGPKAEVVSA